MSTIIDHNGKLAVEFGGWLVRQAEPIEDKLLSVSTIDADRYSTVIGKTVEFTGNMGRIYNVDTSRYIYVDTTGWERVVLERPVKKPRCGKDYNWTWSYGKWVKEWTR